MNIFAVMKLEAGIVGIKQEVGVREQTCRVKRALDYVGEWTRDETRGWYVGK